MEGCELDESGRAQEPLAGSSEHENEPSVSVEGGEFFY
jgi:hypothetical protein